MKERKNIFLLICGPTASGKTDFALRLARELPVEIINADMGQMYAPLNIGTAKPDERIMSQVRHHLFGTVDEPRNITVVEYRARCLEKMAEIWDRGNIPLIVGGSTFYVHALLFPPHAASFCAADAASEESVCAQDLWKRLAIIDPARAAQLGMNDQYRIKRALAIWESTGMLPSQCAPRYAPPARYLCILSNQERDVLRARINERVYEMLRAGWLDECKMLCDTPWEAFVRRKKFIGYAELFDSNDDVTPDIITSIQQSTWRYAKKQMCFWRKLVRDIRSSSGSHEAPVLEVNLTLAAPDLYINQLQMWLHGTTQRRTHEQNQGIFE